MYLKFLKLVSRMKLTHLKTHQQKIPKNKKTEFRIILKLTGIKQIMSCLGNTDFFPPLSPVQAVFCFCPVIRLKYLYLIRKTSHRLNFFKV